jgi:hypothetical protein
MSVTIPEIYLGFDMNMGYYISSGFCKNFVDRKELQTPEGGSGSFVFGS